MAEQVLSIYAGTRGYLDGIAIADVGRFEAKLLEQANNEHADLMNEINSTGLLSEESEEKIKSLLDSFAKTFA